MVKSDKFSEVREKWADAGPGRRLGNTGPSVLKALSDHNLGLLRDELHCDAALTVSKLGSAPLNKKERDFIQAVVAAPWFLTHATPESLMDEDGKTLRLASNHHLVLAKQTEGSGPVPANLLKSQDDIEHLGNGHYVFFSLEAGARPKKTTSRFGETMYRIPLDRGKLGDTAVLMLNDALKPAPSGSMVMRYPNVPYADVFMPEIRHHRYWQSSGLESASRPHASQAPPKTLTAPYPDATFADSDEIGNGSEGSNDSDRDDEKRYEVPDRYFFQASQSLEALALAVVASSRKMGNERLRNALLEPDEESIDRAVNSLFRPQVMVPREFVTQEAVERQRAGPDALA